MNDTLQLTSEQGFPSVLAYEKHIISPFQASDFAGEIFTFYHKPSIRMYQHPPVRTFLVQNIDTTRLYWGLVYIQTLTYDMQHMYTSGSFTLEYIYTPQEMKHAYDLIDRRPNMNYLATL